MEPGFLLNNALITNIAVTGPESKNDLEKLENIRRWQVDALGDEIMKFLS